MAQESADRGDYDDALAWIQMLEAIGEQLSRGCQAKRQAWEEQLLAGGVVHPSPDAHS